MRLRISCVVLTACCALAHALPAFAQGWGNAFSDAPWLRLDDEPAGDEEEHLETDRDSFTPSTNVVGAERILFESSYSYVDGRGGRQTHSFPEILTRVGVNDWLELRIGWNYEIGGGGSVSGSSILVDAEKDGSEEEGGVLYGMKVQLTDQEEWLPESSVILQASTPTSGPDPATQFAAGYVFGWTLPNDWLLDASMRYGAATAEGDRFNQWAPSIVLKIPVHEQWNVHAEYFGSFTDNREDDRNSQYFSPGIHYLISSDCEVGVRVGWGLNHDSAEFFSNVGVGYRF